MAADTVHYRDAQDELYVLALPSPRELCGRFGKVLRVGEKLSGGHGSVMGDAGGDHHRRSVVVSTIRETMA